MEKKVSKTKFDWWGYFKSVLLNLLKAQAVKLLLAKVITTALIPVSWQVWLAKFAVEFLFDKVIIPILNELELEGKYQVDVIDGKKKIKFLNEDRQNPDHVRDAFNQL